MKEKLIDKLGTLGVVLYFVFTLAVAVMPFVMIDASFLVTLILIFIAQAFPITSIVFWIWGLLCAINGVQDIWAIAYYVMFAVMFLPFIGSIILDLFQGKNRR